VTSHFPDRCFGFDQFGPLSIRPCHGCYRVGDDQLWGVTRERKGADHTLAALKSIRAARPGGYRLFVILDNLSANKTPAIRRWAKRENVELCFTPVNASWANPIEAQFGPVRAFVMGGSDHPSHAALAANCRATCVGATPMPATPTSWPPSAANAPVSVANGSSAGADPGRKPRDQTGERSWIPH
jgi:hypothetical protein